MLKDPSVCPALEVVAEQGLCNEARQHASAALLALGDTDMVQTDDGQKHVMLSCKTAFVLVVAHCLWGFSRCLNSNLIDVGHGYRSMVITKHSASDERITDCTWLRDVVRLDEHERQAFRLLCLVLHIARRQRRGICCMCVRCAVPMIRYSGSTMDAMSDAIEGAAVMLYGVSLKYKESANVRWLVAVPPSLQTAVSPCTCRVSTLHRSVDWRPTTPISRNWT